MLRDVLNLDLNVLDDIDIVLRIMYIRCNPVSKKSKSWSWTINSIDHQADKFTCSHIKICSYLILFRPLIDDFCKLIDLNHSKVNKIHIWRTTFACCLLKWIVWRWFRHLIICFANNNVQNFSRSLHSDIENGRIAVWCLDRTWTSAHMLLDPVYQTVCFSHFILICRFM